MHTCQQHLLGRCSHSCIAHSGVTVKQTIKGSYFSKEASVGPRSPLHRENLMVVGCWGIADKCFQNRLEKLWRCNNFPNWPSASPCFTCGRLGCCASRLCNGVVCAVLAIGETRISPHEVSFGIPSWERKTPRLSKACSDRKWGSFCFCRSSVESVPLCQRIIWLGQG